jgi:NAD(P)-dependent dehydrogenase (short-subunit alcohol dehydrogenase family)
MSKVQTAAIVTGSATGIGSAIAKRLATRGFGVLINYTRSEAEARATADACRAAGGAAVLSRGDVADDEACRRLAATALHEFGRIDVLVNCAGTTKFVPPKDLDSLSKADFERIFGVNVVGAFQMARAAAPALRASGNGSIVNISSYSSMSGLGSSLAYAASKGALNTLTKGLAHTLAPEIRVNAVCPGYVDTRWGRRGLDEAAYAAFKRKFESRVPLRAMPVADDVAEAVLWFAVGGRTVTGQLLVLDAGEHMAGGISISEG